MFVKFFEADTAVGGGAVEEKEEKVVISETGEKVETQATTEEKESKKEVMIPKSRFDEVNKKYKELSEKLKEYEVKTSELELSAKDEVNKIQELYEAANKELTTYKEKYEVVESRVKELEGVLEKMLNDKLAAVPEDFAELIPNNLTIEGKLEWLSKAEAKGLFDVMRPKEIGKMMNFGKGVVKQDASKMSPLDKILAGLK